MYKTKRKETKNITKKRFVVTISKILVENIFILRVILPTKILDIVTIELCCFLVYHTGCLSAV